MRIRAITLRILQQFIHDRRTMALMFIAPLLVLSLMSLVFGSDAYEPRIGVSGVRQCSVQRWKPSKLRLPAMPMNLPVRLP